MPPPDSTVVDGQFDDCDNENVVVTPTLVTPKNGYEDDVSEDSYFDDSEDEDDDDDEDMEEIRRRMTSMRSERDVNQSTGKIRAGGGGGGVGAGGSDGGKNLKFLNKIFVGEYQPNAALNSKVTNELHVANKADKMKTKDKSHRATTEQVLDPRTRMIMFKMLGRNFVTEINGCISTGKEANVYYAAAADGQSRAVKVYKTSILTFKDRDRYVTGEFRFRHGYGKGNPRKMVQTWAEKEMRNLARMFQVGILCPEPFILRGHVLLMDFIGTDGWPAPLLKDVELAEEKARELYPQCLRMMRLMFQEAKLVHADLSEFNMLYHEGKVFFIDVSQSVEMDHPNALEFLRKDCNNVNDFFRRKNVAVLTLKGLFDFVTDPTITADNVDRYLEEAQKRIEAGLDDSVTNEEQVAEEVFKQTFIPQKMDEVINFQKDARRAQSGESVDYLRFLGLKGDLSVSEKPEILAEDREEAEGKEGEEKEEEEYEEKREVEGSEEARIHEDDEKKNNSTKNKEEAASDSDEDEDKDSTDTSNTKNAVERRDLSPESWKRHKKELKLERREKLKDKIPKHVKKRKEKLGKERKGKK